MLNVFSHYLVVKNKGETNNVERKKRQKSQQRYFSQHAAGKIWKTTEHCGNLRTPRTQPTIEVQKRCNAWDRISELLPMRPRHYALRSEPYAGTGITGIQVTTASPPPPRLRSQLLGSLLVWFNNLAERKHIFILFEGRRFFLYDSLPVSQASDHFLARPQ